MPEWAFYLEYFLSFRLGILLLSLNVEEHGIGMKIIPFQIEICLLNNSFPSLNGSFHVFHEFLLNSAELIVPHLGRIRTGISLLFHEIQMKG